MNVRTQPPIGIRAILEGPDVRRIELAAGQILYSAADVVALFSDSPSWDQIKAAEPQLARLVESGDFPADARHPQSADGLSLAGVFRLIQSIPSPRAERLKGWLADAARDHLLEAENPEMLALRARRVYQKRGYSRRWVDKRLQGVSTRQELTGEWYRRGATDGEQFRDLTNRLMRRGFGMDVERYRRYKHLIASQNLRDHMSDLELALTTLGETAAVALHQSRNSNSFSDLRADPEDAGRIVARTRKQIERLCNRPVVNEKNHGVLPANPAPRPRRRYGAKDRRIDGEQPYPGSELAKRGEDMQNPSASHPERTVA